MKVCNNILMRGSYRNLKRVKNYKACVEKGTDHLQEDSLIVTNTFD